LVLVLVWSPTPVMLRHSLRQAGCCAAPVTLSPVPSTRAVLATRTGPVPDRLCRRRRGHGALRSSLIAEIGQAGEVIGDDGELLVTFVLGAEHVARPVRAMAVVVGRAAQPEASAHPTPPRSELVGRHRFAGVPKVTTCRKLDHNAASAAGGGASVVSSPDRDGSSSRSWSSNPRQRRG
jgi:hypothetical protein